MDTENNVQKQLFEKQVKDLSGKLVAFMKRELTEEEAAAFSALVQHNVLTTVDKSDPKLFKPLKEPDLEAISKAVQNEATRKAMSNDNWVFNVWTYRF